MVKFYADHCYISHKTLSEIIMYRICGNFVCSLICTLKSNKKPLSFFEPSDPFSSNTCAIYKAHITSHNTCTKRLPAKDGSVLSPDVIGGIGQY